MHNGRPILTILLAITLLVSTVGCSPASEPVEDSATPSASEEAAPEEQEAEEAPAASTIVAGEGWGVVQLGGSMDDVKAALGPPDDTEEYDDTVFHYYPGEGLYINYAKPGLTVRAIFFESGTAEDYTEYVPFGTGTDRGIDWESTTGDVLDTYGEPTDDFKSDDGGREWRRIVYPGISFRFEDEKLVVISVGSD